MHNYRALAFLIFALSLFVRLYGIASAPIHADESHWVSRSQRILQRLGDNPTNATTHLGHPGVPPALIMAASQRVVRSLQGRLGITRESALYIDPLTACRIALAITTAFIPVLVYFATLYSLGGLAAILASIPLALDPHFLSSSRMAHLDGGLGFFALIAALLYYESRTFQRVRTALVAGIFCGLALSSKVAGILLIPIFFVWNALSRLKDKAHPLLRWSDVGAALVGLTVLALLWTRLWHHEGDFLVRLQIKVPYAKLLYRNGLWLQEHWYISLLICAALLSLTLFQRLNRYRAHAITTSLILIAYTLFPQVFENFLRMGSWGKTLADVTHQTFGGTVLPHPHHYLGLLYSLTPPIPLLGFIIGSIATVILYARSGVDSRVPFLTLALSFVVVWCGILSISPKEGWRYAFPAIPFIYIISGFGISLALQKIFAKRPTALVTVLVSILIGQGALAWSVYPFYESYVNPLTADAAKMTRTSQVRPLTAQGEIVEFILSEGASGNTAVALFGDALTLRHEMSRRKPALTKKIMLGYLPPESSDIFIALSSYRPYPDPWRAFNTATPILTLTHAGEEIYSAYRVPRPDFRVPYVLPLKPMKGSIGKIVSPKKSKVPVTFLVAEPETDPPGVLLSYPLGIRSPESDVQISIRAQSSGAPTDEVIATFSLGKKCRLPLRGADLLGNTPVKFTCNAPHPIRFAPLVQWKGEHPLSIEEISIFAADREF